MKHLGLDIGTRRIGVASADETMGIAFPCETIDARSTDRAVERVIELIKGDAIHNVVVGWPVDMMGHRGRATARVQLFVERLEVALETHSLDVNIEKWDERLTTRAAESLLIEANVSRKRRKDSVDQIAAVHILQGYLDSLRIQRERTQNESDG